MKEKILELRKAGYSYNDIKAELGCSKSTISYHCGVGQKEKNRERMRMYRSGFRTARISGNIKHDYTDEYIIENINETTSVAGVLRNLGLKDRGGYGLLRSRIKELLIKNGEYIGQAHLKNKTYVKVSNDDFFAKNTNRQTTKVRNALFKRGFKDKVCESCGLKEWLKNPIPLEVHHIDGDKTNNELNNLQILCPNCHYFTDTYKSKNVKPS